MKLDQKTLEYVFSNRVTVVGYVYNPSGHEDVHLSLEEFQNYCSDFTKFCADHYELTTEQYDRWMKTHGTPQCGEKTKSGKRCKKPYGSTQTRAKQWLDEDGGICAYHERQKWRSKYPPIGKR